MYVTTNSDFEMVFEEKLKNGKTLITRFQNTVPYFDEHPNFIWDIGFAVRDENNNVVDSVTNDYNAFEVISKIKKAVTVFITSKRPEYTSFLCNNERFSIYKKYIQRLFNKWSIIEYDADTGHKGALIAKNGSIPVIKVGDETHIGLGGTGPIITMNGDKISGFKINEDEARRVISTYNI